MSNDSLQKKEISCCYVKDITRSIDAFSILNSCQMKPRVRRTKSFAPVFRCRRDRFSGVSIKRCLKGASLFVQIMVEAR